nr:sulfatase-like hydrolase/transferase [Luteolibacter marinus]
MFLLGLFVAVASAARRPNVLVILTDDQGSRDAGCYGAEDFATPNIDRLAASGVRFTQGYVTHSYCSPSRAGILSGRSQQSFGHEANPPYRLNDNKTGIDVATPLMPTFFKAAGYRSASFGKWHVGTGPVFRPCQRGFDHFWGFLGGGHDYFTLDPEGQEYRSPIWVDGEASDEPIHYLTDDLTDQAINFVKEQGDRPWLVYLAYNAPHAPDQAKPADLERVASIANPRRRAYAAMMVSVDDNVGRLMKQLDEQGLREDTLVFYLSDNGGRAGSADNRPLRGNKGWMYEGGIRVPFIASWPGKLVGERTYDRPVSSLDLLPTALAAAGLPVAGSLEGANLLPFLEPGNRESPHRQLHWRVSGGLGFALREGKWKLVQDIGMEAPELYDLEEDPSETRDLADRHPELVERLLADHRRWDATLEKPRWPDGHSRNMKLERERAEPNGYRHAPESFWLK